MKKPLTAIIVGANKLGDTVCNIVDASDSCIAMYVLEAEADLIVKAVNQYTPTYEIGEEETA